MNTNDLTLRLVLSIRERRVYLNGVFKKIRPRGDLNSGLKLSADYPQARILSKLYYEGNF